MKREIFITGATGFIGSHLSVKILSEEQDSNLYVLVRGKNQTDSENRFRTIIEKNFPDFDFSNFTSRIFILNGDICSDNLGLTENEHSFLTNKVTHIIHSAANVSHTLELEKARKINVEGVQNVLKFAVSCKENDKLVSLSYISTAYVCGNTSSVINEEPLLPHRRFANTYEETKYEAESLVVSMMNKLPVHIFRPSIVVGNSETGKTTSFNVIYYPLKLLRKGMLKLLAGTKSVKLDIVPVNYVVNAIHHILFKRERTYGKIYNLTAGKEKSLSLAEIMNRTLNNGFGKKIKHVPMIPYRIAKLFTPLLTKKLKKFKNLMTNYEPFLAFSPEFRNDNTSAALFGSGIEAPHLSSYFEKLLTYCLDSDWGKRVS